MINLKLVYMVDALSSKLYEKFTEEFTKKFTEKITDKNLTEDFKF